MTIKRHEKSDEELARKGIFLNRFDVEELLRDKRMLKQIRLGIFKVQARNTNQFQRKYNFLKNRNLPPPNSHSSKQVVQGTLGGNQ